MVQLLYFEREENGGLELSLQVNTYSVLTVAAMNMMCFLNNSGNLVLCYIQEDSMKTGSVSCAGMYLLHFQVYRIEATVNAVSNVFFWVKHFLFFRHLLDNNKLLSRHYGLTREF